MRNILATGLLAAAFTLALGAPAHAAEGKGAKHAADEKSLYVSPLEAGNKKFFTMTGWHGTHNYWMAGRPRHAGAKKAEKKAETKTEGKK